MTSQLSEIDDGAMSIRESERQFAETIPHVPWSQIAPDFITSWGYPDGKFDPEHIEILGPTGSGKTYFEATIIQERVRVRDSAVIFVATKPADKTIMSLGFPIVNDWKGVTANKQCIYWPQTKLLGKARKAFLAKKIEDLLDRLWKPGANVVLVIDEIATVEKLSPDVKEILETYMREGRTMGITLVMMKQRAQGVSRDMHSETSWIAAFKPKDEDDAERVAQILGNKRKWTRVLMNLDRESHEFVLLHVVSGQAVITYVDVPLQPMMPERRGIYRKGR